VGIYVIVQHQMRLGCTLTPTKLFHLDKFCCSSGTVASIQRWEGCVTEIETSRPPNYAQQVGDDIRIQGNAE
jgi:methyl coenzyme M reductase alpha subunit